MRVAIEGCAHGRMEEIYDTIELIQERDRIKVDLLLCCGDFQSTRNKDDLDCMAVPRKYQEMCSFYKYFSGEKEAPILTIFIGGNHEASNYLQELPYGGWVAKNIYYLGYAGVINVGGLRICGISGIFAGYDYQKGRYESCPYSEDTKRSVYHVRQLDVWRMKQLSGKFDIGLSHDWPRGIYHFGDVDGLVRQKPFFRDEIDKNTLGSPAAQDMLVSLRPAYWFSAHLHVKFAAVVPHTEVDEGVTKFLALDKCLPHRKFLNVIEAGPEVGGDSPIDIEYDLEWLTVLHLTNHLISVKASSMYLPNGKGTTGERYDFRPTEEEKQAVLARLNGNLKIDRDSFCKTAEAYNPETDHGQRQPNPVANPQTRHLCDVLNIDDPLQLVLAMAGNAFEEFTPEEVAVSDKSLDNSDFVIEEEREVFRTSLSLPAPKNNDEEIDVSLVDDEDDNDHPDLKPTEPPVGPEMDATDDSINTSFFVDNQGDFANDVSSLSRPAEDTPPSRKVFKRRNQSIYGQDVDLQ